jgi:hypothetical protein
MMLRLLIGACLAAVPVSAQFQFSVVESNGETPVNSLVRLPAAAAGDKLDAHFRVRNTGNATASLTLLSIAGAGFSLTNLPALPATMLPGAAGDFTVRFQPPGAGSFSALLKTDGLSVFVLANALGALTVYLDNDGYRQPIDPSAAIDFGAVERGSRTARRLVLVNQTEQPLVAQLSIEGPTFQLAAGLPGVVALDPQASTTLEVLFAPAQAGLQQGELRLDQRRFPLRGTTLEPPLPQPIVTIDLKDRAPASGTQPLVSVRFDPTPRTSGVGKLRIELKPSVDAKDDPAVLFLPTGSRTIDFSVIEGEPNAQFGPAAAIPFQTGTTAGTIIVTAELGDQVESASIEIAPQAVAIDNVQMSGTAAGIEVQVSGFDNTRSLTQASFTFLQKDGTAVAPGAIQQDLAAAFKDYFASSTVGGTFQMKASFPITGNAALIDAVRLVITNAVGQTTWPSRP